MNPRKYLAVVLLFVGIAVGSLADTPRDAELMNLVVGKWQLKATYSSVIVESITDYKADGTFVTSGTMKSPEKSIRLKVEGVWSVKGNILTWTIRKSDTPELQPVGKVGKEEILEIDADHIKYKGIDGQIENEKRLKAPSTPQTQEPPAEQGGGGQPATRSESK